MSTVNNYSEATIVALFMLAVKVWLVIVEALPIEMVSILFHE